MLNQGEKIPQKKNKQNLSKRVNKESNDNGMTLIILSYFLFLKKREKDPTKTEQQGTRERKKLKRTQKLKNKGSK